MKDEEGALWVHDAQLLIVGKEMNFADKVLKFFMKMSATAWDPFLCGDI